MGDNGKPPLYDSLQTEFAISPDNPPFESAINIHENGTMFKEDGSSK